jgi:hypothetical protein
MKCSLPIASGCSALLCFVDRWKGIVQVSEMLQFPRVALDRFTLDCLHFPVDVPANVNVNPLGRISARWLPRSCD